MRVLLLGATGEMGGRTASELLRRNEVQHLTLAGRNERRLTHLAERMRGRSIVSTASFDIRSSAVLVDHMSKHDLVVSCAGPGYLLEEPSVEGALQARTSYISLNDDLDPAAAVARRSGDAAAAGVGIVSGCGASPGLSNLLMALASEDLEEVTDIDLAVGGSSRDGGGPAAELHFVSMLAGAGGPRADGSGAPHPVYFPEPVGWIETFPCGHSEQLGSRTSGVTPPVTFRIGLAEKAVMDVIRASIVTGVTSREPLRRSWLRVARPFRPVLERLGPGSGGWTALRVDVHGRAGGRTKTVSYGVVDHLVNLASITIGEGAIRLAQRGVPGVAALQEIFEPKPFLAAVGRRGIRFARLEPHTL